MISIVAAASDNDVIGKNGTLPWKMPADMKFFKNLTMGHTVVMGRKTYESMGKPLSGRKNVVITRDRSFKAEGCIVLHSPEDAFKLSETEKEVFIIGGADIYKTVLSMTNKIYLTRIHGTFDGDAYFPKLSEKEWVENTHVTHPADEKNPYSYSFIEFVRKKDSGT